MSAMAMVIDFFRGGVGAGVRRGQMFRIHFNVGIISAVDLARCRLDCEMRRIVQLWRDHATRPNRRVQPTTKSRDAVSANTSFCYPGDGMLARIAAPHADEFTKYRTQEAGIYEHTEVLSPT